MRISLENETYENLSFQNGVLDDLSRWPLGLSVAKPVPSIDQRLIELVELASATRFVRLFSYVPGHSVSSVQPSAALLQDVGRSVAAMGIALASVPRHMPPQNLVWSISNALDLLPWFRCFRDGRRDRLRQGLSRTSSEERFPCWIGCAIRSSMATSTRTTC